MMLNSVLNIFTSEYIYILLKTLVDINLCLFPKKNQPILLIDKFIENLLLVLYHYENLHLFFLHKILFQFLDIFHCTQIHYQILSNPTLSQIFHILLAIHQLYHIFSFIKITSVCTQYTRVIPDGLIFLSSL